NHAELLPEMLFSAKDNQVAVSRSEGLYRNQALMRRAWVAQGFIPSIQVPDRKITQHGKRSTDEVDSHIAPSPGFIRGKDCCCKPKCRCKSRGVVDHRDSTAGRGAVRIAGDTHISGVRLHEVIVTGLASVRSSGSEATQ